MQPSVDGGVSVPIKYSITRDPTLPTRHLVIYNTGPSVGVTLATIRRVFEAYGKVERLVCPNPKNARIFLSFEEVQSAVSAKAERNRPAEVEERVRQGIPKAAEASDVFAPRPGEPCPLLGRWLKVAFADMRVRGCADGLNVHKDIGQSLLSPSLREFKALDALALGGTASSDSRSAPCPLCARRCGGQRGLRMHLIAAHPLELKDRAHLAELLQEGSTSTSPALDQESLRTVTVAGGASAKGTASKDLPLGFMLARGGDVGGLRTLVEGELGWDPAGALDKHGSTPLDWAAGEGRLEVCRYLLQQCGADPGKACASRGRGEGRTALHWAARNGHEEVCRLLLDAPRPSTGDGTPAKSPTSARDDKFLDPDVTAADGTSPFHWACWGAHLGTCQLLFARGADHRKVNMHGCNAAHWCGLAGDVDVCRWLSRSLAQGGAGGLAWAKSNLQGHTICHKAALKGHSGLLQWLWKSTLTGTVPREAWGKDEGGYFPADVARLAGHVDLGDWLRANVDIYD